MALLAPARRINRNAASPNWFLRRVEVAARRRCAWLRVGGLRIWATRRFQINPCDSPHVPASAPSLPPPAPSPAAARSRLGRSSGRIPFVQVRGDDIQGHPALVAENDLSFASRPQPREV